MCIKIQYQCSSIALDKGLSGKYFSCSLKPMLWVLIRSSKGLLMSTHNIDVPVEVRKVFFG